MKTISLLAVLVLCLMVTNLLRGSRSSQDKSWFDEMFARESVPIAKPSPEAAPEAPRLAEAPLQNPEPAVPAVPIAPAAPIAKNPPKTATLPEKAPAVASARATDGTRVAAPAPAVKPVAPAGTEKSRSLPSNELAKLSTGQKLVCKRPGEPPRSLTIERNKGRFELIYERPDGAEAVAWSQSNAKPCQQIRERISRKLESAGYHCSAAVAEGSSSSTERGDNG